jgi:hypothetical protein
MQTARIVQAVILMMIVALAASCAASKEYSSKLFAPRTPVIKDSQVVALRFLDLDKVEPNQDNWVTTDIINGKDTTSQTLALDNLAKTLPAIPVSGEKEKFATKKEDKLTIDKMAKTSSPANEKEKPIVRKENKITPVETEPVAKSTTSPDGTRIKSTREDKNPD